VNRREICSPTLYMTKAESGSRRSGLTSTPRSSGGKAKPVDWEYQEQCALFEWAKLAGKTMPELEFLTATLNGVRLSPFLAKKAKRGGMKKGPFDIYLDVRRGRYSGLRVELKRKANKALGVEKGRPSKDQLKWGEHYTANGFLALICYGADEAIQAITKYLMGAGE
jgi:hypothetical protein